MTLTQLRTALRVRLGVATNDTFYTDAVLTDLINEAMFVVENEHDWPWDLTQETITTVIGTAAYTPNANWYQTKELFISPYEVFDYMPLKAVDEIPNSGRPLYYAIAGNASGVEQIIMKPTPDAVYTVTHRYYKTVTALSADGDTPIMPTQFHYAILAYALYLAHHRADEGVGRIGGREAAALKGYQNWLRIMHDARRRGTQPLRPYVRPGSWI